MGQALKNVKLDNSKKAINKLKRLKLISEKLILLKIAMLESFRHFHHLGLEQ